MPAPGFRPDPSILAALQREPMITAAAELPRVPATQSFEVETVPVNAPIAPVKIPAHIARSLLGPLIHRTTPAERAQMDALQAELNRKVVLGPAPVPKLHVAGFRAGDLLRTIDAHPGTVTIAGTGTAADGRYALEQFTEDGPGHGTARLRRISP